MVYYSNKVGGKYLDENEMQKKLKLNLKLSMTFAVAHRPWLPCCCSNEQVCEKQMSVFTLL
jgi:hypothetical protein